MNFAQMPVWVFAPNGFNPEWRLTEPRLDEVPPEMPVWAGPDALWVPAVVGPVKAAKRQPERQVKP